MTRITSEWSFKLASLLQYQIIIIGVAIWLELNCSNDNVCEGVFVFLFVICADPANLLRGHGFVLFDLILHVPSTIFLLNRDGSSWVEPVLS